MPTSWSASSDPLRSERPTWRRCPTVRPTWRASNDASRPSPGRIRSPSTSAWRSSWRAGDAAAVQEGSPHHRNDDLARPPRSVELAEEDVLPRPQGKAAAADGDRLRRTHERTLDVRGRVVVDAV